MIFGGADRTFRREGTMVVGGNILVGDTGREEEGGEIGGCFVV